VTPWLLSSLLAFAPGDLLGDAGGPLPIVGGTDAGTCQFPTVTSMLVFDGSAMICSGTLIHPQVVMTAAHCIIPESPIDAVGFGEHAPETGVPAAIIDVAFCQAHPDYETMGKHDVAFCMLSQPLALEITPVLDGCEAQALQPGLEIVIAGFGSTFAVVDDAGNITEIEGVGTKRYTTQTIHSLDDFAGAVNFASPNGSQSACFGDSGGPAFVRMSDGTWRVFGTGSQLFDPGGLPPPVEPGNACGVGASYGNASLVVDWLETSIGFDITPCHDAMGVFTGGPACGNFPTEIHHAIGDWMSGCVGGVLGGGLEVCEPFAGPFDPDPTGGDDTTTGGETTTTSDTGFEVTGDPLDTGDPTLPPDPSTTMPPPVFTTTVGGDSTGDNGETSSSGANQGGDEGFADRGCGCNTRSDAGWLALFGVIALRRRRSINSPLR
jgi:trypsin